jgi:hypothetical protein
MATKEFTDSKGVVWRVWDVTPTHIHPITKSEEFMEPWVGGWLAFESANEKRRLVAPYPANWDKYELAKLEMMCKAAEKVGSKKIVTPKGMRLVKVEAAAHDDEWAQAERTFESPRGRLWTVRLHECLHKDGGTEQVLRFTAGDSVVDLREWPPNWMDLVREDYAMMLLDAEPPRRMGKGELPQRRRDDRPR